MRRVDFVVSNGTHHVAMFRPVIHRLATETKYLMRVISLCELRGLRAPHEAFAPLAIPVLPVVPRLRPSPSAGRTRSVGRPTATRRVLRTLGWYSVLRWRLAAMIKGRDLVVLPNDSAFPYRHLTLLLRRHELPFVLVQEGIRFRLPVEEADGASYGTGGAAALAVWGETSADLFKARGVPEERIHITGSPRFDSPASARSRRGAGTPSPATLLLLTNPIDDQGFCTARQKIKLVQRFIGSLAPMFNAGELRLILKPHPREDVHAYHAAIQSLAFDSAVSVATERRLSRLFETSDAAIVLASTTGLEALEAGLPLGVLEIPGAGFVHDYVEAGVALGLAWNEEMADQVGQLLASTSTRGDMVQRYLARSLHRSGDATGAVSSLIRRVAGDRG